MKKYFYIISLLAVIVILAGCGKQKPGTEKENGTGEIRITDIDVISAVDNDDHLYRVNYPHTYVGFDSEWRKNVRIDFSAAKDRESLTQEDVSYVMDYVSSIPENNNPDGKNIAYFVWVKYEDENGEDQYLARRGRDVFPEGWGEFVDYMNGLCGGEYLLSEGEVVEVTPALLTELFGVTDEDVRIGTLEDFIRDEEINVLSITGHVFRMDEELVVYYKHLKEPLIAPYRPYTLESMESTEEEYGAFMEAFLERLEGDWEEVESDQQNLREYVSQEYRTSFYMGKTTDLSQMDFEEPRYEDDYYRINLSAHMEDMVCSCDFIYSTDKKFFFVNSLSAKELDQTDVILKFIGEQ